MSIKKTSLQIACFAGLVLGASTSATAQTADYTMHEWGLLNYATSTPELVTSGFGTRTPMLEPRMPRQFDMPEKPIIYLTPGPTFDMATSITARIDFPGGYLHEVYPLSFGYPQPVGPGITTYQWPPITFQDVPCDATGAPRVTDNECTSLGAQTICEAAELIQYIRPVDACMQVAGRQAPVLLWNAVSTDWPSPIMIGGTTMSYNNLGEHPLTGVIVREGSHVMLVGDLEPGGHFQVSDSDSAFTVIANQAELIAVVYAELTRQGLTDNEANDFLDAWRPDQLQFPPPWGTFGFFDEATIDAHAPLTLTPEPSERVRVLAFASP